MTLIIGGIEDDIRETDLKMIELELNMYEMDDACKLMDELRLDFEKEVKECVFEMNRPKGLALLVCMYYA